MRFDSESYKTELRNELFRKVNKKGEKKTAKKKQGFRRERFTLVGMEAITWRKTRNYKEKTKSIFDREKWKKKRAVGRRNPGPNQWITP